MALLPRKPRKQLSPKLTDMVESASHEEIQKAIARSRVKAFLATWLAETKDG